MDQGMMSRRRRGASAAGTHVQFERSPTVDKPALPVWVHRLHADGLPTIELSSRAGLVAGSQRFIERWSRVASGY